MREAHWNSDCMLTSSITFLLPLFYSFLIYFISFCVLFLLLGIHCGSSGRSVRCVGSMDDGTSSQQLNDIRNGYPQRTVSATGIHNGRYPQRVSTTDGIRNGYPQRTVSATDGIHNGRYPQRISNRPFPLFSPSHEYA